MDEQPDVSGINEGGGISRRRILGAAGMAGAAAWVVPTVLSLDASPAMASGAIKTSAGANEFLNPTNNIATIIGALGVVIAVVSLNSDDQVITPPDGSWVQVFQHGTTAGNPKLTVAVFKRYFPTDLGQQLMTFSWPTATENALSLVQMAGATTVETFSDSGNPGGVLTGTSVTAPAITVGDALGNPSLYRQLLWVAGTSQTADDVPHLTPPLTSVQLQRNDFVLSTIRRKIPYPTAAGVFPATSGTLAAPGAAWVAGMLSIY
jgi:hypothetical protein